MEILSSSFRNCMRVLQCGVKPGILTTGIQGLLQTQPVRHRQTKHWNPKFKRLRKLKFIKVDLPNFREKESDLSHAELKKRMKKRGILPSRPWIERPFYISCTGGIFEAYVPPEGDGKKSIISSAGAKQKYEFLEKKSKSMLAIRKIRTYEEDFDASTFANTAQEIYIEAHKFMASKDRIQIREFVTERAYPEMRHNTFDKTIHWSFLQSLEPPKVVHARVTDVISKENLFAQVTVRFNTQQKLAIYDRFGRLMHGSEILSKDVLEYVVFEKHISNEYGKWRLHHKILPDWLPAKDPTALTYKLVEEPVEDISADKETKKLEEGDNKENVGSEVEPVSAAALNENAASKPNTTSI